MRVRGPAKRLTGHVLGKQATFAIENRSKLIRDRWDFSAWLNIRISGEGDEGKQIWVELDPYEAQYICDELEKFRKFVTDRSGFNHRD